MAIDKSKLTGVEKVYPLNVSPYEQYVGDFQNPSVVSKVNAMIQSLHQIGRLTNETVSQWNNVMKWIVDGGMDEIAETITNEKVSVALNEVMRMLDVSLDNGLKELAENVTDTKIDEMLKSGQFESMISESLVEINEVVEGKLEGFNLQLVETDAEARRKKELEDFSPTVLAAIEGGEGTNFNLLSIPQDRSVTGVKTDFLQPNSINLFNYNTATVGSSIRVTDGTVATSAQFTASDYIKVLPNTAYRASSAFTKAFYDINNVFISAVDLASFTTPANAAYVRASILKDTYTTFMLVQGSSLPSSFVSFDKFKLDAKVAVPFSNVEGVSILASQTNFINRTNRNLFDPSKVIPLKWVNTMGVIADTTNFQYAGMYPVESNTQYITNGSTTLNAAFYDANKVFISSFNNTKKTVFTTPANASFIALTIMPNETNTYMLVKGNKIPTHYISFEQYELSKEIGVANKSKWFGKRHGAIGDSITEYPVSHIDGTMMNYVDVVRTLIPFAEVRNMGKGGERMCDLVEILEHNGVTDADIANRDLITVFLGTNDKNTPLGSMADTPALVETSFYASIKGVIEYILNRNKTVRLAFITPLNGVNHTKVKNDAIKEVCAFYSIPVLDLFQTSGINPLNYTVYYGDAGVHPNSTGHYRIGEQIARFIETL